mmetsp:Transcript_8717/g.18843  ORF Transcript_8717/g.18843 Transcript_8717/m.18843 type:complete len:205 (-) Transcript_8717:71-685(-)
MAEFFKALGSTRQSRLFWRIDEQLEFNYASTFHDCSFALLHQRNGRRERSTGSNQIVNDQNTIAFLDLVFLDREAGTVAVFCFVFLAFDGVRHFPFLSHHDKWLLQSQCDGRSENEASCIKTSDGINPNCFVTLYKDVHDLLKDFGFVKEPANVVETIDSLERKIWQIFGDFFGFFAILLVFEVERRHGFVQILLTILGAIRGK